MSDSRPPPQREPRRAGPPPGPPWDSPLEEATLAFIDLEMTGLDPRKDRIVEVCIERVRGLIVEERLDSLVYVGKGPVGNAHIHGIDENAIASAPPFDDLADRILALLDGAVLVAHAAPWDIAFLEAELARCHKARRIPYFIDTLTLSRRVFALKSHSLEALVEALNIPRDRAHRAGDDVRALRRVFEEVKERLKPKTARDLWFVRIGERIARPEIVAACVLAAEGAKPVILSFRPSRKPATTFEACITEVRTDLDPPRVMGYALPGRGRFDLRADRILSVSVSTPPAPPSPGEPEPKSR